MQTNANEVSEENPTQIEDLGNVNRVIQHSSFKFISHTLLLNKKK